MAESVVSFAAKHIESLIEADLFDVLSEAKAVQEELESIEEFMAHVRENKEFLLWLPKLRRIAYDAEDVVDTYISDATSSTSLHRGLYKFYKAHYTSKKLQKLGKEMKDVKAKMQEQYVKGSPADSEKHIQGQMIEDSEKEKNQIDELIEELEGEINTVNYDEDIIDGDSSTSSLADSVEDILEHVMTARESKKAAGGRGSQHSKGHVQADDEFVVGIEKDVEELVESLTAGKAKGKEVLEDGNLDVLAIAGMGGSGKTTLARNIYNHARVQKHFKYQAWVTLSQQWTASEVLSDISSQIHTNKHLIDLCQHNRESELDYLVRSCLRMKKCLIVLDDLWDLESLHNLLPYVINLDRTNDNNNHHTFWDVCMNDNYDITKVVITSRYRLESSSINNNTNIKWRFHDMQLLDDKNGWDLFNKVSSNENGKELAREYSGLANQMLIKCGGLPLAIVALGKLLKTKDSIQGWERVYSLLVNKEGPNDLYLPVNDILALSYRDLNYCLKPCFLYFGLFPEDFQIKAGTLIRMWIAEGFVQKQRKDNNKINGNNNNNNNGETSSCDVSVARELLQKLIDHTMVQGVKKNYTGKVKTLRVHDIMRDLCIKEAQELDFLTVCSSQSDQFTSNTSRRAALNLSKCSTLPVENSHIRSLFLHEHEGVVKRGNKGKQKTVLLNLSIVCEKFKLLRVLDINGITTFDGVMPREIGNLIHLRYLRIRSTNIRELPRTIGKLRNLITLDYWDVSVDSCGIRLPNVLWKLRKLRYLYLPNEMSNTKESLKLRTMMELQTLWGVRGGNWMLKEMSNLSTKLNKLSIQGISSLDQMMSVLNCGVITTHNRIYSLALDWYGFPINSLGGLSSNTSLKKLRLMGKANMPYSKPLNFPSNLEKLDLYYTQLEQPESMEILGELNWLKCLILAKDSFIGKEWKVSKEKELFKKLECLKLCELPNLEEWDVPKGSMPCLKKLSILCCTNLKQIPESLSSSSKIENKIKRMPNNFNGNNLQLKNKDHVDTITNCNSHIFSKSYLILSCVKWIFLILGLLICIYYCVYKLAKYSGLVGGRTWFKT